MESETLITFLLPSIHQTAIVEVLGSWDNFTTPYRMQYDQQKGHGSWFGCFLFSHIICDGDPSNCSMPRKGCLKMGGTYWYYYRRNGNLEFHNPAEAYTNSCPLLPGQTVNILDVPYLSSNSLPTNSPRSSPSSLQTINPQDRFKPPVPPPKKSLNYSGPHSRTAKSAEPNTLWDESSRRSSVSRCSLTSLQQKAKAEWLAESLGRLQTAVVDYCMTMLAGRTVAERKRTKARQLPGRRTHSAPGTGSILYKVPQRRPGMPEGSDFQHGLAERPQSSCGRGTIMQASDRTLNHEYLKDFQNPFVTSSGEAVDRREVGTELNSLYLRPVSWNETRPRTWHGKTDSPEKVFDQLINTCETYGHWKRPASAPSSTCRSNRLSHTSESYKDIKRAHSVLPDEPTDSWLERINQDLGHPFTDESEAPGYYGFGPFPRSCMVSPEISPSKPFETFDPKGRKPVKPRLPPLNPHELARSSFFPSSPSEIDWTVGKHEQAKFCPKYSYWTPVATSPSDDLSIASARNSMAMKANAFFETPASPSDTSWGSVPDVADPNFASGHEKTSLKSRRVYDDINKSGALDHFASQETLKPATTKNNAHSQDAQRQVSTDAESATDDFSHYRLPSPTDSIGDLSSLGEDIATRFGL